MVEEGTMWKKENVAILLSMAICNHIAVVLQIVMKGRMAFGYQLRSWCTPLCRTDDVTEGVEREVYLGNSREICNCASS